MFKLCDQPAIRQCIRTRVTIKTLTYLKLTVLVRDGMNNNSNEVITGAEQVLNDLNEQHG